MITITNQPPKVCLSENPAIFEVETNLTTGDNLHVLVKPQYWNESDPIGTDVLYPPYEGRARCDLSEYLRSYFERPVPPSEWFQYPCVGVASEVENRAMRYSILAREGTGFPATYSDVTVSNRYVVPGRIPKWLRNWFYKNWDSYWDWIQDQKPFLTWAPKTLKCSKKQTRKLYWLCDYAPASGHELSMNIKYAFTDGSTENEVRAIVSDENFGQYKIYQIPAGYASLGIEAYLAANYPTRVLVSWSIKLMDASTVVSEERTFVLDDYEHYGDIELAFDNGAGGFDTVLLTGVSETRREHTLEQVDVLDTDDALPTKRSIFSDATEKVKADSGWLTAAERLYLSDLLASREVYELTADGMMPVVMSSQTQTVHKDNDTLISLQVEFERVAKYHYENGL